MRGRFGKAARQAFCPAALVLIFSSVAWADGISGLVRDEQKAVLPGVTVTIRNVETGLVRRVVTGNEGRYDAPNLPPGTYDVSASLAGFRTTVRRGVTLTVAQDIVVDLILTLGGIEETVDVAGGAPLVDTTSAAISGLVDERAIRDLPLVSRSWDELITLQAGTTVFRRVDPGVQSGHTDQFSVSGQRPTSNKFYQDGMELGGAQGIVDLPGSAAGVNLGVEGIREFRVLTSSYSPEFGKRAGGAVITVTKSGTNEFRGSLIHFYRNDAMDAPNFFAVAEKDPFTRHNYGGSLGGPIVRDRTFFFVNYEGIRETLSTPVSLVVPNEAAREGFLPGPTGEQVFVGASPKVRPLFNLWPLPNAGDFGDGTGAFEHAPERRIRENYFLGRFDHQFSDTDSLFVSYTISDADQVELESLGPFFDYHFATRQQRATIEYKRIATENLLNSFRIGFSRPHQVTGPSQVVDLPGVPEFTPGRGIGGVEVGGLDSVGTGSTGSTWSTKNHFQLTNQLSYVRGRHTFEVGGQFQRIHFDESAPAVPAGVWEFAGLSELLLGTPQRFNGALPDDATGTLAVGLPAQIDTNKAWRQTYGALYFRDKIRWTSNLTVDLGLRYEVLTSPTETNGRTGNFPVVDVIPPFNHVLGSTPDVGEKIYQTTYGAGFAPRVGLAWDPFGHEKTSLRAGFGVFYDQIESEYRWYWRTNPPFDAAIDLQGADASIDVFPSPWGAVDIEDAVIAARVIDPELDVPTVLHFNVGLEQQVGTAAAFKVSYVGSRGSDLLVGNTANLPIPEIVDGELFWPADAPVPQPLFGRVRFLQSGATSQYDSLQTEFETRFAGSGLFRRLRSKFAYAFSKTIDDLSQLQSSAAVGSRAVPTNPLDLHGDRGLSAQHRAHLFTANFTFDLSELPLSGVAGALLNNWQVSGILTIASGLAVNINTGFNRSRNGHDNRIDRPNLIAGGSSNPILGGYEQYFDPSQFALPAPGFLGNLGSNTLIGPGLATMDLAFVKRFPVAALSDSFNVQLRAEVFNVFNRNNFGLPDPAVFVSSGAVRGAAGRITNTSTPNRQMQVGLRMQF